MPQASPVDCRTSSSATHTGAFREPKSGRCRLFSRDAGVLLTAIGHGCCVYLTKVAFCAEFIKVSGRFVGMQCMCQTDSSKYKASIILIFRDLAENQGAEPGWVHTLE